MGAKNQYSSINFFRRIYRRYIDRKFLWAISTRLFLVAGKASRVLVDCWITSETFHEVQNANRRCTGHATMSTERGNYMSRLITVHAPFLDGLMEEYWFLAPMSRLAISSASLNIFFFWNLPLQSSRCTGQATKITTSCKKATELPG